MSDNKLSILKANIDTRSTFPQKGNSAHNMTPVDSSVVIQPQKFAGILSAVWETIYYESMKDIWDGILYDPIMDYCGVWLQRSCQLNVPFTAISDTPDDIDAQDTDEMLPKVFPIQLSFFFLFLS